MGSLRILSFTILLAAAGSTRAQQLPFPLDVPLENGYGDDIPLPEDVIGHRIGTRHTEPHQVVDYFRAVAEASDRVTVQTHARSYEGRPLLHAVVTSPENHARLEAIRVENARLSESPRDITDAELESMPVIVYAGYSIHGNEASGTEAALLLLYHLAAGQGAGVADVLRNAVVIIDPMFNPDGRARFTTWVNTNRGSVPVSDPNDREHQEPWPGGRTNHYWFDLNRDWLPAQHPESQGRLEVFHRWRPQVLTDHHEMGSEATFFFQPGIPSRNNPNTPARTHELTAKLGDYHARKLDAIGSLYYTRESFDDFYYGKGSSYADVNGAIGILFEQASSRALERRTDRGPLTYAFTVRNHFVTSLSTIQGAVDMRKELLAHQRDFYADASIFARDTGIRGYVVDRSKAPARSAALAEMLRRHRIRLYSLARDFQDFRSGEAFVIPLDQPQARLIKSVMERVTTFQDSLFYDISTWTLPLAFGVETAEMRQDLTRYLGSELVVTASGRVVGGPSFYAYVMPWGEYYAPRALHYLQQAGLTTSVLKDPFSAPTAEGRRDFPRGSILIPVVQQNLPDEAVHRAVQEAAAEGSVDIFAVETGLAGSGPDLGTGTSTVLTQPRVALLTGAGVASYEAGEVWHLLSERFRIPVSLVDFRSLGDVDLSRYNTIIAPGGSYSELPPDRLKSWIRAGGRLVTLRHSADWAIEHELLSIKRRPLDVDSLVRDVPFENLPEARGAHQIGGSILEVKLDASHPIGYGFSSTIPVFRSGEAFYDPSMKPGANVAVYADDPLLSGYLSAERLEQVEGSVSIVAERYGDGAVIAFIDNPNFRAFWYGTNGLFLNALFFGQAF